MPNAGVAMIRDGVAVLQWPAALTRAPLEPRRQELEKELDTAIKSVRMGSPSASKAVSAAKNNAAALREALREQRFKESSSDYIDAIAFLRKLSEAIEALRQPGADRSLSATVIEAATVSEFIEQASQKGLRIAPAASGDEPYYRGLYNALSSYDLGLSQLTGHLRAAEKVATDGQPAKEKE